MTTPLRPSLLAAAFVAALTTPGRATPPEPLPSLALAAIPAEKSARPTPAEWRQARPVALVYAGPRASRCGAFLLREWLKVRCTGGTVSAVTQLGGERDGVTFWIDPPADRAANIPGDADVQLPLRRGDRRVLQLWTLGPGYDGPLTVVPALTLQEEWVDDGPNLLLL